MLILTNFKFQKFQKCIHRFKIKIILTLKSQLILNYFVHAEKLLKFKTGLSYKTRCRLYLPFTLANRL